MMVEDVRSTAPVLDPGRGRTETGQLFAYARDDRPWGGTDPPVVAYVYAPDRKAVRPVAHLDGFVGVLQVDGYSGYRVLAEKNAVSLAFCWAHLWMPPHLQEPIDGFGEYSRLRSSIRPMDGDAPRAAGLDGKIRKPNPNHVARAQGSMRPTGSFGPGSPDIAITR
jgi:hypothetical protein